jgi:hypothetical protein
MTKSLAKDANWDISITKEYYACEFILLWFVSST